MAEKHSSLLDIDLEVLDYLDKSCKSQLNDFWNGPAAIQSEQFWRWITKKPLMTKEEVRTRTENYIAKEKEIWNVPDNVPTVGGDVSEGNGIVAGT